MQTIGAVPWHGAKIEYNDVMLGSTALVLVLGLLELPTVVPVPPTDPLELELTWRAPAGCPSAAEIEQRIRALLPGDPNGAGVLQVDGEVVEVDGGVALSMRSTFAGHSERRTLRAPSCSELGEATAVLLAIALEPSRADELGAPPQPPLPTTPPPEPLVERASDIDVASDPIPAADPTAVSSVPDERSPMPSGRDRRPTAAGFRLAGGVEAGAMPLPSGVLQGAALLLWPHARAELVGTWMPPRTRATQSPAGAGFQLGALGLQGCGQPTRGPVEIPLCLGLEGGATRARFDGRTTVKPWVAGLASVGVARAWGRIGLWGAAELVGTLVGYRFFDGAARLLRQFPVSGRLLVGIELRGTWKPRRGGQ